MLASHLQVYAAPAKPLAKRRTLAISRRRVQAAGCFAHDHAEMQPADPMTDWQDETGDCGSASSNAPESRPPPD